MAADEVLMVSVFNRWLAAATMAMAGLAWIVDSNPWSGPVVMRLTPTHGVHMNDWFTVVLWALAAMVTTPARTRRVLEARLGRRG